MKNVITCLKRHLQKDVDKYFLQSFTPKNDINIDDYKKDLDFTFNGNSKSIAFFGADGAGKSSIIETYKKKHNGIRFLHIALAHHEGESDSTEVKESVLEGIILNQLIHQINPKKIPLTKFKVKREQNRYSAIVTVLLVMILLVSILHLTKFSSWQSFVSDISLDWIVPIKQFLLLTASNEAPLFSGIICFVVLFTLMFRIVTNSQYRNIVKKVSLQGNEIELFLENKESYFDKYLNDVLYLFEKADADVIVFEDIGGYITKQIFQRLRNINRLVNDRRNTPLRFLYLLSDDVLNLKERTKFFDFTFSFIGYNIYERFVAHIKKVGISKLLSEDEGFIEKVSSYINDMRLLIVVCNEFWGYPKLSNLQRPCYKKLFAMMIYKNRFPKDYRNSRSCKGFVYSLFLYKNEFMRNEISTITAHIDCLTSKIQAANDEPLKSKQEIEIVYAHKIEQCMKLHPPERHSDEIQRLQDEKAKRIQHIENQKKEKIAILRKETRVLEEQKKSIQHKTYLSEILTSENIDDIFRRIYTEVIEETDFNINERSQCELLKYLVQNGYVDETYEEYMYC